MLPLGVEPADVCSPTIKESPSHFQMVDEHGVRIFLCPCSLVYLEVLGGGKDQTGKAAYADWDLLRH